MNRLLLTALLPLLSAAQDITKGIAWFGLETQYNGLMCTWQNSVAWNLKRIQDLGFNTVRIPFSHDYVRAGNWHGMDELFEEVTKTNLSLVLDFHRLKNTHQSFKPWTDDVTFDDFLKSWELILNRYENHTQLVGVDVWNEYQGDNFVEWNNIARQIVDFIDKRYGRHNWTYYVQGTNWAGNIHDVFLDDMDCADRIRVTIHKYWFSDKEPLEENWEYSFGLVNHDPTKICVGEYGFISGHPDEVKWFDRFTIWLKSKGIRDSFFWTWSWNSGDTGGVLLDDCTSIDCAKMYRLKSFWS